MKPKTAGKDRRRMDPDRRSAALTGSFLLMGSLPASRTAR